MLVSGSSRPRSDLLARLERRVATNGSAPLISFYDLERDERTELSARTFANWVDKTANLLVSMDCSINPRIANTLLLTHPGHWVSLIWTMAIWQAGGIVIARFLDDIASLASLDAAVIGPDDPHPVPSVETIACSLHPLALGFASRPDGVTDYAEVLTQPDVHWRHDPTGSTCLENDHSYSWADIAAVAPCDQRRLIPAHSNIWQMLTDSLIAPILGNGSTVVVVGGDLQQHERIATQERAVICR